MVADTRLDKIKGSLFGGAIGDALGYPVEFMPATEIFAKYGPQGITSYKLDYKAGKAIISDDTQMTLFTANGILVAATRGSLRGIIGQPHTYIWMSYQDWLRTQQMTKEQFVQVKQGGYHCISWLCDIEELFAPRAPGMTCLSALRGNKPGSVAQPINKSKGCGGLMRVAPLGLFYDNMPLEEVAEEGAEVAALTHGHSLGYMPAAVLACMLAMMVSSQQPSLKEVILEAAAKVKKLFSRDKHLKELVLLINRAVELAENNATDLENITKLGEGWVAEEALAISLYCSLRYEGDFSKAIIASVNHSGDSDSTGAITGNILGAWLGFAAIEDKWKENLELADVIEELAIDLARGCPLSEYGGGWDYAWESKYITMTRPSHN